MGTVTAGTGVIGVGDTGGSLVGLFTELIIDILVVHLHGVGGGGVGSVII